MRLSIFLFFAFIFAAQASSYSQSSKLTLDITKAKLVDVLDEIEEQTDYYFYYNLNLDDYLVDRVKTENQEIREVLDLILPTMGLTYEIIDRYIVIKQSLKNELNYHPSSVVQQQKTVSGKVTDSSGQPLPGVTVAVKGTSIGTVTNFNGNYSLTGIQPNVALQFSFVGMKTQELTTGSKTVINVMMEEETIGIEEVVAVGYGTLRKSDITGSISSVKSEDIKQLATQRADQAIQGRTAGVQIVNSDGAPGNNTVIRVRGYNSITGASEPLVIVDGLQGVSINTINPQDIASMEILKDASATAIYGSRGSNGVILITTKTGTTGKPVIDVDVTTGIAKLSKKLPQMNAAEYAKLCNTWRMLQTGGGATPTPYFTSEEISYFENTWSGTDWQDELFRTAAVSNANISVSGATEKLKYMVSAGYIDQEGIMLNSSYDRLSLRANLAADVTEWADFGVNYSYTREHNASHSSYMAYSVMGVNRWAPTVPVYDANGNYSVHPSGYGGSSLGNPIAEANEPIYFNPTYNNNVNMFLNFKLLKGLSIKIMGGALITNYYNNIFYNTLTDTGRSNNGSGTVEQYLQENFQNTNIITYDRFFGKHHLTVTGVMEQNSQDYRYNYVLGKNFLVEQLNFDNMSGAQSKTVSSSHSKRALTSYLGRINYSYNNKYLLTLSCRADGSSVFGEDNKWGYFPSGSVAWRISQEGFLKDSEAVTDLKLRASYGSTGNQSIYPYQSFASLGSGSSYNYPLAGGTSTNSGYGVSGLANTSLKWETTTQTDFGVDLALFKGRLTSTIDIYKKTTEDLLMYKSLPQYFGIESVLSNVGSVENKGLEIQVGGDPIVGRLKWSTSFNISFNKNKVLDLGEADRLYLDVSQGQIGFVDDFIYLEVGKPVGQMSGWKFEGLWGADEEAEARSYGQLPGDLKFADLHGVDSDGNITDGPDGNVNWYDRIPILHAQPKFTFGWSNQLSFKQLDVSMLFVGSYGNEILNAQRIRRETPMNGSDPKLLDYWTPQNQNTDQPAMYDMAYRESLGLVSKYALGGNTGATSRFVEDGSYIRLKTITFGYTLNPRLLKSAGIQKTRFYFTGTNLLTVTKYKGYDPESASYQGKDAVMGIDLGLYPQSRMYSFGVNLIF